MSVPTEGPGLVSATPYPQHDPTTSCSMSEVNATDHRELEPASLSTKKCIGADIVREAPGSLTLTQPVPVLAIPIRTNTTVIDSQGHRLHIDPACLSHNVTPLDDLKPPPSAFTPVRVPHVRSRSVHKPPDSAEASNDELDAPTVEEWRCGKPNCSYGCLIGMALIANGSLPVSGIYKYIQDHYPYFKTAPEGWKNSIRHCLSLGTYFCKAKPLLITRHKGFEWKIAPESRVKVDREVLGFIAREQQQPWISSSSTLLKDLHLEYPFHYSGRNRSCRKKTIPTKVENNSPLQKNVESQTGSDDVPCPKAGLKQFNVSTCSPVVPVLHEPSVISAAPLMEAGSTQPKTLKESENSHLKCLEALLPSPQDSDMQLDVSTQTSSEVLTVDVETCSDAGTPPVLAISTQHSPTLVTPQEQNADGPRDTDGRKCSVLVEEVPQPLPSDSLMPHVGTTEIQHSLSMERVQKNSVDIAAVKHLSPLHLPQKQTAGVLECSHEMTSKAGASVLQHPLLVQVPLKQGIDAPKILQEITPPEEDGTIFHHQTQPEHTTDDPKCSEKQKATELAAEYPLPEPIQQAVNTQVLDKGKRPEMTGETPLAQSHLSNVFSMSLPHQFPRAQVPPMRAGLAPVSPQILNWQAPNLGNYHSLAPFHWPKYSYVHNHRFMPYYPALMWGVHHVPHAFMHGSYYPGTAAVPGPYAYQDQYQIPREGYHVHPNTNGNRGDRNPEPGIHHSLPRIHQPQAYTYPHSVPIRSLDHPYTHCFSLPVGSTNPTFPKFPVHVPVLSTQRTPAVTSQMLKRSMECQSTDSSENEAEKPKRRKKAKMAGRKGAQAKRMKKCIKKTARVPKVLDNLEQNGNLSKTQAVPANLLPCGEAVPSQKEETIAKDDRMKQGSDPRVCESIPPGHDEVPEGLEFDVNELIQALEDTEHFLKQQMKGATTHKEEASISQRSSMIAVSPDLEESPFVLKRNNTHISVIPDLQETSTKDSFSFHPSVPLTPGGTSSRSQSPAEMGGEREGERDVPLAGAAATAELEGLPLNTTRRDIITRGEMTARISPGHGIASGVLEDNLERVPEGMFQKDRSLHLGLDKASNT